MLKESQRFACIRHAGRRVRGSSSHPLIDGRSVRELGRGDSFGEIALLRDTPRTATVRATTNATLVSLTQDEFLSAVAGHTDSASAAEAVVTSRIGPRVDPASPA